MNDSNLLMALHLKDFKFIKTRFVNQSRVEDKGFVKMPLEIPEEVKSVKSYSYKCLFPVETGDFVVVEGPNSFPVVVLVEEVCDPFETLQDAMNFSLKWAIQKLDVDFFTQCIEKEKYINNAVNKAKALKVMEETKASFVDLIGEDQMKKLEQGIKEQEKEE